MENQKMKVFETMTLNNLELKNRIVRSATHSMLGNLDGSISREELTMFEELASNDIGLIIAGQFFVSRESIVAPGSNELSNDSHIAPASKIMDIARPYGAKVIAQINHAGSHAYSQEPLAPTRVELSDGRIARAISLDEIEKVKEDFVSAAIRAKSSGFDGVQLHGAHGYLLCEFLKPSINKRDDQYGGSSENRFRLVREILEEIKDACGHEYPVFIKLDSNDFDSNDIYTEDLKTVVRELKNLGIESIEFSGSEFGLKTIKDHNYFQERAKTLKGDTDVATMVVGGVRNFSDMEAILDSGADMVSLCRPFICEPDLITKLKNGQEKARCVTCRRCHEAGKKRCVLK